MTYEVKGLFQMLTKPYHFLPLYELLHEHNNFTEKLQFTSLVARFVSIKIPVSLSSWI